MKRLLFLLILIALLRIDWGGDWDGSELEEKGDLPLYVVDFGVHSNFILPIEAFDKAPLELKEIAEGYTGSYHAPFLEIGWGDQGFYQEAGDWSNLSAPIILRALFAPSPSVLQIVPLNAPPEEIMPKERLVKLAVSHAAYQLLLDGIASELVSTEPIGASLYGGGNFYQGRSSYHLFFTCNNWVSKQLREIGAASSPLFASFSRPMMMELRWRNRVYLEKGLQ